MLTLSLLVLGGAALGGLFLISTRSGGMTPTSRNRLIPAHGLTAAAGVVLLFVALPGGPEARLAGWGAGVLAGVAAGGLAIRFLQKTGRRPTADLVAILHAAGALLGLGLVALGLPRG